MADPRPGTLVRGTEPVTGRVTTGWLRGPHPHHRSNGLWCVDNPKWNGDPERMPARQSLVVDIEPVTGKELEDTVYKDFADKVLDGETTREDAVRSISRDTKTSQSKVSARLEAAIAEAKEQRRVHAPETRKPKATKAPAAPREKAEHAEPKLFAALRDELGMTNKQLAAASAEAGLGSTLSRMTELTHSKGASMAMFRTVEKAWRQWAKAHKKELAAQRKAADE